MTSEDIRGAESLPDKSQSLRLKSIRKRMETERNKHLPKQRKTRERPAPLSKYRRKTANARERQRMHQVNLAFEKLKATIPHHKLNQVDEKKDTKITTLRCAIGYINSLSELLLDIKEGKSVSPQYYCTDAQLGLEPEDKKRGEGQRRRKKKKMMNKIRNKPKKTRRLMGLGKVGPLPVVPKNSSLPPPAVLALARAMTSNCVPSNPFPFPPANLKPYPPTPSSSSSCSPASSPNSMTNCSVGATVVVQSDVSLCQPSWKDPVEDLADLEPLRIDLTDYSMTAIQDFLGTIENDLVDQVTH